MEIKKYTGFTLIELLAVIVILAVIALIATPIIMNVINDSKEGAAKDAMYGYVKAVELASTKQVSPTTDAPDGDYTTENGNLKQGSEILEITFKGTKPANNGTVILSKGSVVKATLEFDGITVEYNGKKAEIGEGSSTSTYEIGKEVYFDPTGAVTDCASGKEWTPSNTGTTCYKWNIIKINDDTVEMFLDHNTTANIGWNLSKDNANGPKELYNQLKTDTNGWNRVETLTSGDNVTRVNTSGSTYTINYSGMKARLIGAQELVDIVNDTTWTPTGVETASLSSAVWLYPNLSVGNSATEPKGYWTDTAAGFNKEYSWAITYKGVVSSSYEVNRDNLYGLRPVVRVLKSNI